MNKSKETRLASPQLRDRSVLERGMRLPHPALDHCSLKVFNNRLFRAFRVFRG